MDETEKDSSPPSNEQSTVEDDSNDNQDKTSDDSSIENETSREDTTNAVENISENKELIEESSAETDKDDTQEPTVPPETTDTVETQEDETPAVEASDEVEDKPFNDQDTPVEVLPNIQAPKSDLILEDIASSERETEREGQNEESDTSNFKGVVSKSIEENVKTENVKLDYAVSNFWLEGNYKKVVKRIEDGARTLDDLVKMVHERAEIENSYATKLKAWQKKWMDNYNKTCEYGTLSKSIKEGLDEGVAIADLHSSVHGGLEELNQAMQQWKLKNYPKVLTKFKEVKRSEEAFLKAQKPWTIKHNEVLKCMKAYHSANHLHDLSTSQEKDAKLRAEATQEQLNKITEKVKKNKLDIENTRDKYKEALRDIGSYNPKYIDDMKFEFSKCQAFEESRRSLIKENLCVFHACVDRNMFQENYKNIYSELGTSYRSINIADDLNWYEQAYGIAHPFVALEYVEYDTNVHSTQQNNPSSPAKNKTPSPNNKKKSGLCATL